MEAVGAVRLEVRSSLTGPGPPAPLHTAELASHFLTNTKHRNILHNQHQAHFHYYMQRSSETITCPHYPINRLLWG